MWLTAAPAAARFVVASVIAASCAASTGVAGADPQSPSAPKTTIDHDGTYAVGTDIAPGTYSSAGPVGNGTCYWKRIDNPDGPIDNAMSKKPKIVQIEASNKAFKTTGCQTWQQTSNTTVSTDLPGPIAGIQLESNLGILNGLLASNGQQVPRS